MVVAPSHKRGEANGEALLAAAQAQRAAAVSRRQVFKA
jgi:hypothetical protein